MLRKFLLGWLYFLNVKYLCTQFYINCLRWGIISIYSKYCCHFHYYKYFRDITFRPNALWSSSGLHCLADINCFYFCFFIFRNILKWDLFKFDVSFTYDIIMKILTKGFYWNQYSVLQNTQIDIQINFHHYYLNYFNSVISFLALSCYCFTIRYSNWTHDYSLAVIHA